MKTYIFEGSLTAESPLAACSRDLKDREGGDATKPVPIPSTVTRNGRRLMFPATGIRGKLRRAARDLVHDAVIRKTGNDESFSLEQHCLLTLDGLTSSGSSERSTVALEASFRRANPMISVFGAGDAGILGYVSGHLAVDNAICIKAIPQGEVMTHGMKLLRSNEIELGLMLKALNIFSLEPLIGAHVATGCGIVSGCYKVYEVALQGRTQIGEVTLKPFDLALVHGGALVSAINAFEDFMISEEPDFSIPVKVA